MRTQGICTTIGRETRSTETRDQKDYETACIVTTENKHFGRVPRLCTRLPDKANPECIPSGLLLPPSHSTAHGSLRCHGSFDPSRPQQQGQESGLAKHPMGWGRTGREELYRRGLRSEGREAQGRKTVWSTGSPNRQPCSRRRHSRVTIGQLGRFRLVRHSWGPRVFRVTICMSVGRCVTWDDPKRWDGQYGRRLAASCHVVDYIFCFPAFVYTHNCAWMGRGMVASQ